jgi:hypothetical protein
MNPELIVLLPANDPDVFMIKQACEAALNGERHIRFCIDNGALKVKVGEGMWSAPMFGSTDPKFTPDFEA